MKIKKNPYDEIEFAILKKAEDAPQGKYKANGDLEENTGDIEPEYKGQYVRRRALVDQMLINNRKTTFSYADEKRIFYGMGADGETPSNFASTDLAEWFSVFNQTQIKKPLHDNLKTPFKLPGM